MVKSGCIIETVIFYGEYSLKTGKEESGIYV